MRHSIRTIGSPAAIALQVAVLCASSDAAGAVPSRDARVAIVEVDWQTSPLDLDLRGMNGERYRFRCPPGKPQPSRVIGSGPYTDQSSICSAGVHAGAIHAMGGEVLIEIRPGETHYVGSEHNYIRSTDYDGRWSGSFVVLDERAPNRR